MNIIANKAKLNEKKLSENTYPGRGIIIGETSDEKSFVQIYFIMGRSENSRNRIFLEENGFVRTKAWDEKKVIDPSLIIYYPSKVYEKAFIITNGDQTDTIYKSIKNGSTFKDALEERTFEPDGPNFTPRISGILDLGNNDYAYALSILKTESNNEKYPLKQFFYYENSIPGFGHCITTYDCDGNPLPSFSGEPYLLKVFNSIDENIDFFWNALDDDNKVSLMVRHIDKVSGKSEIKIINKLK
jgi:IMP cyclohydrolase